MSQAATDEMQEFYTYQESLKQFNDNRDLVITDKIEALYAAGIDAAFISAGWGEYDKQITNNFCKLNRYGTRFVMDNYVRTGYTFITRPELNLTTMNLRTNRVMNLLNTADPNTLQFALRASLDTRYARHNGLEKVISCPFMDYRNPFFTLLTNNLTDISGGPSYQLEVFTDEPGYFGESQSIPIGSDSFRKPFDIQLNFTDPIGGPIEAAMKFWTKYIELVTRGEMIMYPDQINDRVLNYTVSIYRFLMDPSFRFIRKWAKYTGCFPISRPGATVYDYSNKELYVESLRKFSIGFRCGSGNVDEDDPIVLKEFNTLVERYFPTVLCLRPEMRKARGAGESVINTRMVPMSQVDDVLDANKLARNPILPEFNYSGIPYILDTDRGPRLEIIRSTNGANNFDSDVGNEVSIRKHVIFKYNPDGTVIENWPLMNYTGSEAIKAVAKVDTDITEHIQQYEKTRDARVGSKIEYI